jgi:hypothetical protein
MARRAAQPACRCHIDAMAMISISADACRAITGGSPEPSLRDDRAAIVDHKTHDRLTALRGQARATTKEDRAAAAQRLPSWRNRLALFGCRVAL